MLTTNFYAALACSMGFGGSENPITSLKNFKGVITSNTSVSTRPSLFASGVPYIQEYSGTMLLFGKGTNEESETDYTIDFIPDLKSTQGSTTFITNGNKMTATRRIVVNNPTTTPVTVNEFAIQNHLSVGSSYMFFIVSRTKLEEPFVIDANETVNFDLTITYDLPTNYTPYV